MSLKLRTWTAAPALLRGTAPVLPPPSRFDGIGRVEALTGCHAAARSLQQLKCGVMACHALPPHRDILYRFRALTGADGRAGALEVESDRAAMGIATGATAAGVRAFAATSGMGVADMLPACVAAAGQRLPVVVGLVNRHAGGLFNLDNDHTDAALSCPAGWIQLHAESPQEVYDLLLHAYRVAEDARVRLPCMVCFDAFSVSHAIEPVRTLEDAVVRAFVGDPFPGVDLLEGGCPTALGALVPPGCGSVFAAQMAEAMRWVPEVMDGAAREYAAIADRRCGRIDTYRMEDAELALVAAGSICGTARAAIDVMRARGVSAGLVKIRMTRPFPCDEVAGALCRRSLRAVAVIDRVIEGGTGGPLYLETTGALARHRWSDRSLIPPVLNVIAGVAGGAVNLREILRILTELGTVATSGGESGGDSVRFLLPADPETPGEPLESGTREFGVVFLGRSGQGTATAARALATAAILSGRHAHGYPGDCGGLIHGVVRSGARISDSPLDRRDAVERPDALVLLDESLLEEFASEVRTLGPEGLLIVNTARTADSVRSEVRENPPAVRTIGLELAGGWPDAAVLAELADALSWCSLDQMKDALRMVLLGVDAAVLDESFQVMDRVHARTAERR